MKVKVSKLKVENVVSPPKKPIVTPNFKFSGNRLGLTSVNPKRYPNTKQPTAFTTKVPNHMGLASFRMNNETA